MIKDVIRLKWHARLSHAQIATTLKISKGVVAKYVGLATAAGLDWEAVQDWSEQQLSTALQPRSAASQAVVVPDWGRVHLDLDRKGVTLMLLWQEYVAAHPEGRTWRYTQFCEHYKTFAGTLKRSMRQHRRAGEKLFIDFAGPTVPLRDGARAQVFVSAMAASSYVFACATPHQRLDDWVEGMVRALHFYGGVPQLIVPDNASAVIASPDRYEPRANETVQDLARHYGTSVLPARPRSPRDKATAESSVQVVTRWVLARLRHHRFDTVAQVDAAIAELLPGLNQRPFQKLPGSRARVFAELDAPALMPLPAQRYELVHPTKHEGGGSGVPRREPSAHLNQQPARAKQQRRRQVDARHELEPNLEALGNRDPGVGLRPQPVGLIELGKQFLVEAATNTPTRKPANIAQRPATELRECRQMP
jgi:transposase